MLLNMLRVEDANPENLVRSSFLQFQIEKDAPGLELQVVALQYILGIANTYIHELYLPIL